MIYFNRKFVQIYTNEESLHFRLPAGGSTSKASAKICENQYNLWLKKSTIIPRREECKRRF